MGCAVDNAPKESDSGKEDSFLTVDELKFLSTVDKDTKFCNEEIDRIVGDAIFFMDTEPSTRSSATRTVSEILPLTVNIPASRNTRSGDDAGESSEEDLFYLVNFDNDAGYSVIAADHRIKDEIVLFVGEGNINENSVDNPGLQVMLSRLDDYAARSVAEYEHWQDSVKTAFIDRMKEDYPDLIDQIEGWLASLGISSSDTRIPPYDPATEGPPILIDAFPIGYGPWANNYRIAPMITTQWGQTSPFNDTATTMLGKEVYTGCTATASIQLMAHWGKPTTFHGQTIDWATTRSYASRDAMENGAPPAIRNTLANVFWYFGEDVDMDWGEINVEGSGALSQDAINVLKSNGFTASSKQDYSFNPVYNSLVANRPVYMRGNSHKVEHRFMGINWWSTYKEGHAWLIDGYLDQTRTVTWHYDYNIPILNSGGQYRIAFERVVTVDQTHRRYFHNNYGWASTDDGYYTCGLFDPINGADLPSNTRADEDKNFIYNLEIWTGIH